MPKKEEPSTTAASSQRPMTIKLPTNFDQKLRIHVAAQDTDLSKFTRAALREKLAREGAFS